MSCEGFRRYNAFFFSFCQTLHAAIIILRILVGPNNGLANPIFDLNEAQSKLLHLSNYNLIFLYTKVGLYAITFLSYLCCSTETGLKFRISIILWDIIFGIVISIALPISEIIRVEDINTSWLGLAFKLEIAFYVLVLVMIVTDIFALKSYQREIRLISMISSPSVHIETPSAVRYRTFDTCQPSPYTERPAPNRRLTRVQELPGNLQVAGLRESSCILSDGEGGIIFVQNVSGSVLSFQARTVEETKVVWITADAIRRNPLNPELLVLTETEISQLDFGNERENMRQALHY